jgi:hypothetical protein
MGITISRKTYTTSLTGEEAMGKVQSPLPLR